MCVRGSPRLTSPPVRHLWQVQSSLPKRKHLLSAKNDHTKKSRLQKVIWMMKISANLISSKKMPKKLPDNQNLKSKSQSSQANICLTKAVTRKSKRSTMIRVTLKLRSKTRQSLPWEHKTSISFRTAAICKVLGVSILDIRQYHHLTACTQHKMGLSQGQAHWLLQI